MSCGFICQSFCMLGKVNAPKFHILKMKGEPEDFCHLISVLTSQDSAFLRHLISQLYWWCAVLNFCSYLEKQSHMLHLWVMP